MTLHTQIQGHKIQQSLLATRHWHNNLFYSTTASCTCHTRILLIIIVNGQPTSSDVVTEFLPQLADGLGDVEDLATHEAVRQLHEEETIFSHYERKILHHYHHPSIIDYTLIVLSLVVPLLFVGTKLAKLAIYAKNCTHEY